MGGGAADAAPDDSAGATVQAAEPTPTSAESMVSGMNRLAASAAVSDAIEETCSVLEISGYNYADVRYLTDRDSYPRRVLVGSETFPTTIAETWPLIESLPGVIGDFTWTGWDYLGEAGIGGFGYAEDPDAIAAFGREYPFRYAYCGDLDVTGLVGRSLLPGARVRLRTATYVQRPIAMARRGWPSTQTVGSWTWPASRDRPSVRSRRPTRWNSSSTAARWAEPRCRNERSPSCSTRPTSRGAGRRRHVAGAETDVAARPPATSG
jgi:hypothetical protein